MQLAAESRGIVYRDRMVLESGSGRVENMSVDALSLRIRPEGAAEVAIRNPGQVEVAALSGPVRVTTANGVLLANLQAGRKLAFMPEAVMPSAPTTVTGCLESAGSKFMLTDETSLVRFEMMGAGLAKEAGHRVQIAGTVTPVPDAMSRVQSTSVKMLSKKCSNRTTAAAAAGIGSAGAAGASTASAVGMAVATKVIIAGVVVAGAATGTAVAMVANDSPAPISPSSR